jgi:hypothetical protein
MATKPFDVPASRIAAHKRIADRSKCQCPYCSAIKNYVQAKLKVRLLERHYDERCMYIDGSFIRPPTSDILRHWRMRLAETTAAKERAKLIDISGWVGGAINP